MSAVERARELRRDATWAERRLWRLLRSRRLAGYKFRRQHPQGPYFLDAYCVEARVAVEVDGGGHGFPDQRDFDLQRDRWLAARGIVVKRFWNHQFATTPGRRVVIESLWRLLQERAPHPENVACPRYRRRRQEDETKAPSP